MLSLSSVQLLSALVLIFLPALVQSLPYPPDNTVGTIWTFPNETWIENLAVRQNGVVLATSINRAAIYAVDPFAHTAVTVHQFAPTDGILGIAEVENDVFVAVSSNISLATSTAIPGSAKIWRVDMVKWDLGEPNPVTLIADLPDVGLPDGVVALPNTKGVVLVADASEGLIWRINTTTGAHTIAIASPLFKPTNPLIPLGVDGIHIPPSNTTELYFTNLGANLLGKVAITANGSAAGPILNVTTAMVFPDDFTIAEDGRVYVAGDNTLWRVGLEGKVNVLAGGPDDLTLEGATSAQFGRTRDDEGVLYVGTNGGVLAPVGGVVHGGQILAINVELFD